MWQLLAKPLLGVVTDSVKGFVQTKKLKSEVKIAQIEAEKQRNLDIAAGKIQWEQSAVDQMKGSWKDEFVLLALMIPAICAFIGHYNHTLNVALKFSVGFLSITATFYIWLAQFHWGYVQVLQH